jgi:hypothetical protein
MNMEDLTVEDICRRINIQANLNDLQSKNKEKISLPYGYRKILTSHWRGTGQSIGIFYPACFNKKF